MNIISLKSAMSAAIITSTILLAGCGGPFAGYSNQELKDAYRQCDYSRLSPAGAQRCNNIKKECQARKEDSGFRC